MRDNIYLIFLENVSYSKYINHYQFLNKYTCCIEIVNLVSDESFLSLTQKEMVYLNLNQDFFKLFFLNDDNKLNSYLFLREEQTIMQREFFRVPAECWTLMTKNTIVEIANKKNMANKLNNIVTKIFQHPIPNMLRPIIFLCLWNESTYSNRCQLN